MKRFNITLGQMDPVQVVIRKGLYGDHRTALELLEYETGEPYMVVTASLPHEWIPPGCVIVKNWSENEGILEELQRVKVLGDVKFQIATGFVKADVVELLPEDQWIGLDAEPPKQDWIDSNL